MNQKKQFVCSDCHATFPKWRGKCTCGLWNSINEEAIEPKVYRIPRVSQKRKEQVKDLDTELDIWYEEQRVLALKGDRKCACCGADITSDLQSDKKWINRRNICHLLPKGKYYSVATHPLNKILLCWDHHTYFDNSWLKARRMNIWGEVVRTVRLFIKEVEEPTGKLPEEFFEN